MSNASSKLVVVGGRQRRQALDLDEWQAYERGVIAEIDPRSGEVSLVVEYQSPADVCADVRPSIVFKAGDLHPEGKRLVVCTQTEVLEYDTESWKQTYYYSHRSFNDLHHVCYRQTPTGDSDSLLIANTGLDQVVELACDRENNQDSKIVNEWSTCKQKTWDRFDATRDYRKVDTTKPHQSHPNFVFQFEGHVFATRFHQQDALELDARESQF